MRKPPLFPSLSALSYWWTAAMLNGSISPKSTSRSRTLKIVSLALPENWSYSIPWPDPKGRPKCIEVRPPDHNKIPRIRQSPGTTFDCIANARRNDKMGGVKGTPRTKKIVHEATKAFFELVRAAKSVSVGQCMGVGL